MFAANDALTVHGYECMCDSKVCCCSVRHTVCMCVCVIVMSIVLWLLLVCALPMEKRKKNIKLSNNRAANKQQTHFSLCNFQMNSIDKNSNPSKFHKR